MRHIHLNPLGGVAGDMFVAALSHAFPEHATAAVRAAGTLAGVTCRIVPHTDDVLAGQRFRVEQVHAHDAHDHPHDRHGLDHHHHGDHEHHPGHDDDGHDADSHGRAHTHLTHTRWSQIRRRIEQAELPADVRRHAVGIFGCLADAEARVHGVDPNDVAFHEVGAADSIADIVAAAWMIAAIGPATWSTAPLPTGSGTVRTASRVSPFFGSVNDRVFALNCSKTRIIPASKSTFSHLSASSFRVRLNRSGHFFAIFCNERAEYFIS